MDSDRMSGTVKWFSRIKGYGFIAPDGEEQEIFVHYSGIEGEGYRNLEKGQRVSFVVEETAKGPQAVAVRDQMVDEYAPGAPGMGGGATFEPDDFGEPGAEVESDSADMDEEQQVELGGSEDEPPDLVA